MQINSVTSTFGRVGPSHRGIAPLLGDVEPPAPTGLRVDPCSVEGWYEDHPVGERGAALSVLATLGAATVAGAAGGAVAWKQHRIIGGVLGALAGWGVGYGISAARFMSWKDAGGLSHTPGACVAPAGR